MKDKKDLAEVIAELEVKLNDTVSNCMQAIKASDTSSFGTSLGELEKLEEQYNKCIAAKLYDDLAQAEKPIIEAIKTFWQPIKKHRVLTDKATKVVIGVELVDREQQIDLLRFCRRANLDVSWQYDVEKFNKLLCLRAAKDVGASQEKLKAIAKSYYLHEQAEKIEMGGTPVSNTQMCKTLQGVLDAILPPEADTPVYRCTNYDVGFLLKCYTKEGKKENDVASAKHAKLRQLMMKVAYHLICNKPYEVLYKPFKNER